jgi:hypothetical protein
VVHETLLMVRTHAVVNRGRTGDADSDCEGDNKHCGAPKMQRPPRDDEAV